MEILHFIESLQEAKLFDFSNYTFKETKDGNRENDYAVIISGGWKKEKNFSRYWNDCAAIYSTLVNIYGYYDDHIYVLISDGTSSGHDRRIGTYSYDSSPLDLDGDGDNDIQYSATKSNITSVFNTLKGILDSNDHLFIFTTDHGYRESGNDVRIRLWGENETMRDDEFANEVNKINAGRINIVMGQCSSGGFIDDLEKTNRVIATACRVDQPSYAMGIWTYDEFVYHWISAVAGETPEGDPVDADTNNDGWVSMREAFVYAESHDTKPEDPQYNSIPDGLGCLVSLDPYFWSISGPYIVCTSNSTFTLTNIPPSATASWSAWNWVTPSSGTGSSATIHATCSGIGDGKITFTVSSSGCGSIQVQKDILVGGPDYSDVELDVYYSTGQQAPNPYGMWLVCPNTTYHIYVDNNSSCSTSDYSWTIPSGWYKYYQYQNMISINTQSMPGGRVVVKAETCCSECGNEVTILTDYLNNYWDCGGYYFSMSPNPAQDYVEITAEKDESETAQKLVNEEYEVRIYNSMKVLLFQTKTKESTLRIDTKQFKNGVYFVHFIVGREIKVKQLIVNH